VIRMMRQGRLDSPLMACHVAYDVVIRMNMSLTLIHAIAIDEGYMAVKLKEQEMQRWM